MNLFKIHTTKLKLHRLKNNIIVSHIIHFSKIIIRNRYSFLVILFSIYQIPNNVFLIKIRNLILSFSLSNIVLGSCLAGIFNSIGFSSMRTSTIEFGDIKAFHSLAPPISDLIAPIYLPQHYIQFPENSSLNYTEQEGSYYRILGREYDPRLMPFLWINNFKQVLEMTSDNKHLDMPTISNFELPFRWESWLNLKDRLTKNPSYEKFKSSCSSFKRELKISANISDICVDYPRAKRGFPNFKIMGPKEKELSEQSKKIIGATYLLYEAPLPERVLFMGLAPKRSALIVPVDATSKFTKNNDINSDLGILVNDYVSYKLSQNFSYEEIIKGGLSLKREIEQLSTLLENSFGDIDFIDDMDLGYDITRLVNYDSSRSQLNEVQLSKDDFVYDLADYTKSLKKKLTVSESKFQMNNFDTKLLSTIESSISDFPNFAKYFHEALILGKVAGTHYDWRFFDGITYSKWEHAAKIHKLSRAWLRFSQAVGIKTWLGHGSMLGWHWNGINMPWDNDLDVQITMKSLIKLARNYNQTLVVDLSDSKSDGLGTSSYLVDVSSNFYSREKGNGKNTIDARFIDTSTGLYVDITGLAFTESVKGMSIQKKESIEFNRFLDSEYVDKDGSTTYDKNQLYHEMAGKRAQLYNTQSVYNCRNNHFYSLSELSPLIPTLYEGVIGWIPKNYVSILKREYSKGLTNFEFSDHIYRPMLRLWVPKKICSHDRIGNDCYDDTVLYEFKHTSIMTQKHKEELLLLRKNEFVRYDKSDELPPFRIDPWVIKRAQRIGELT